MATARLVRWSLQKFFFNNALVGANANWRLMLMNSSWSDGLESLLVNGVYSEISSYELANASGYTTGGFELTTSLFANLPSESDPQSINRRYWKVDPITVTSTGSGLTWRHAYIYRGDSGNVIAALDFAGVFGGVTINQVTIPAGQPTPISFGDYLIRFLADQP